MSKKFFNDIEYEYNKILSRTSSILSKISGATIKFQEEIYISKNKLEIGYHSYDFNS